MTEQQLIEKFGKEEVDKYRHMIPRCSVCGEFAINCIQDTICIDNPNSISYKYEPSGPIDYRCDVHNRESETTLVASVFP